MKKIIKIFTLMLLIVLFFGITTSQATLTVQDGTTADEMIAALDNGEVLTGISHVVRKRNAYLYCRQHGTAISADAEYTWANGTKASSMQVYPGTDANGYAKAYILAGGNYDKHNNDDKSNERQWAWWQILGQETGKNNVYLAAEAYQKFKTEGKEVTVKTENAKSDVTETNAIYGPINIEYSYVSGTGYSFGGFNYAFFNTNGENVSDKVQLCTLAEGTYTSITSTKETDGYYSVRTISYNNVDLYAVTQDRTIQKVNMKIQTNDLECEASVYELKGTYKTGGHYNYCMDCYDMFENAIRYNDESTVAKSIIAAYKADALFLASDGNYYEYSYNKTIRGQRFDRYYYGSDYESGSQGAWTTSTWKLNGETIEYTSSCNTKAEALAAFGGLGKYIGNNGEFPVCNICSYVFPDTSVEPQRSHIYEHITTGGYYTSTSYYFVKYNGCDTSGCGDWVEPDDDCESQRLFIVDTATATPKVEIEAEIDLLFIPPVRIELGKYNSYGVTTNTQLTGAEYTVQAMQNGAIIYSKAGLKSGETIDIMPITYDNVYVKITETKAPNGYIMITAPINAIMVIDGAKTQWYPSFGPSEEAWSASGFDAATWGGWTYVDDGSTALPNDYMSQNGDYVNVSVTSGNGSFAFKVSAYNEPKINKLELFKVDGTNQALLAGAKFKATLANVKTITINGQEIQVTEETEINLETNANGKCLIDAIELIDENKPVIITINEVQAPNSNTEDYYYKNLDTPIVITVTHTPNGLQVECEYDGEETVTAVKNSDDNYSISVTVPNTRVIDISGKVWLDGQTGIKPADIPNGNIDSNEELLSGIKVKLYEEGKDDPIQETVTDSNGEYKFKEVIIGKAYNVVFEYYGINYESTILGGDSKADENETERTNFNNKFTTINYKEAIGIDENGKEIKTSLGYNYNQAEGKSILNTKAVTTAGTIIKEEFRIKSSTAEVSNGYMTLNKTTKDLNLGLVKRGTDLALSTDVYTANVKINGQETEYAYNKEDNRIIIDNTPTSEEVIYNLNLYASDYNYRIRNYVSNDAFTSEDYVNDENPEGVTTGDELEVFVTYKLNLQNQSSETTKINEVKYVFDSKYTFIGLTDNTYTVQEAGNVLTINLNGLSLTDGETKTLYLIFQVTEVDNVINTGDFYNSAEITSYSTDKGLIDQDSQPGNFTADNQNEDDNDTAGGIKIQVIEATERLISGKVFDEENNNVNDVIVQLIELKEVNGKVYEYIWQETVSGTDNGKRLNADGSALETYTYSKADGYYEFKGFIPGDYIVRFIYGDGTAYDMTENVIKYNGQDYKSMADSNYSAEWYNNSTYTEGASVARDNEARRLETMAYSVEVNSVKGLLLKLLGNGDNRVTADTLNLTEKEILVAIYNSYYDSDIVYTKIEEVSDFVINNAINALLKDVVLPNTWMCAETSKIKVSVETEDIKNTEAATTVNGTTGTYIQEIPNINLGLELRPETKIELKKYITGFRLVDVNGHELVDAYVDVNEYLNNPTDISNKVQGIKDNLTILNTVWQYEVPQTEINTKVEGAKLEFEYTLVVENTGDSDYLSEGLANAYNTMTISNYKTTLTTNAADVKSAIKNGSYNIGAYLGASYYAGGEGTGKVRTEVVNIRDYVNNDLTFIFDMEGKVEEDSSVSPLTHRILTDTEWEMVQTQIDTVLKTTESTGKMDNTGKEVMYTITLGKDPISSTGNLSFENYIAEVMSYTNAAGRRTMTSTPGNAEIIDHEHRAGKTHEIDEADTARIQIGTAAGEDQITNYIIIIAVAAGIALVAIGAFVIKKYIIK